MHAFIVGCQRCGTTYLAEMLDQHPQIRMVRPLQPEPKFFLSLDNFRRGGTYYDELYGSPNGSAVLCEKSCSYLEHNEVLGRIKGCFPESRVLILLRNPVERTISHYFYSVRNGLESRPIEDALFGPEPPTEPPGISMSPFRYVARSCYGSYVNDCLKVFPDARVLITETVTGSSAAIQDVYEYLGVDRCFVPARLHETVNAGVRPDRVPEALRRRLSERFSSEIRVLEELVDRDLSRFWES